MWRGRPTTWLLPSPSPGLPRGQRPYSVLVVRASGVQTGRRPVTVGESVVLMRE
ncbi:hypothetical protein ACFW4D_32055 [Paenibacillus lactis]|uniref:hypothetical protein n=1 Tax=Paenibacillus lactis TaxID=228574 RepID=UPI00368C14F8